MLPQKVLEKLMNKLNDDDTQKKVIVRFKLDDNYV